MPPKQRLEMIRGMVAGLADRLKNEPDDIPGWQRLARSYRVLGEAEKARDAYGHIAKQQPNNAKALADYAGAIARTLPKNAAIPPALAALGDRILGLNPSHTGALWFTGMARAEAGDTDGARKRWTRLLAELDPNSPQYTQVKKDIEALDTTKNR
jgi:cytochrome c-type biogenesis protein CcmH